MELPQHLGTIGIEAWHRAVAECEAKRIDCQSKYDVLERYAVTYQLWLGCQAAIRTDGQTINGERNPRMADYHQLVLGLGRIRTELGLGPLASSKMRVQEDEESAEVAEIPRRRIRILRNRG